MFAKKICFIAAVFIMPLSAHASDKDANKTDVAIQAPDCYWGDATFDEACTGFSAKMAANVARYIAEHSRNNMAYRSINDPSSIGPSQQAKIW